MTRVPAEAVKNIKSAAVQFKKNTEAVSEMIQPFFIGG